MMDAEKSMRDVGVPRVPCVNGTNSARSSLIRKPLVNWDAVNHALMNGTISLSDAALCVSCGGV